MRLPPVNCDIWTVVDFGKGPVEIRCTEVGDHEDHVCVVRIVVDPDTSGGYDKLPIRNIFETNA